MAYTEQDLDKEIKDLLKAIDEKMKAKRLSEPSPEEIREKANKAERKRATTQRYINDLNQDEKTAKAISYFADNGIALLFDPDAKMNYYDNTSITIAVSNDNPDEIKLDEIRGMLNLIDKFVFCHRNSMRILEAYEKSSIKNDELVILLMKYTIMKYEGKSYHGFINEDAAANLMLAAMCWAITNDEESNSAENASY